MPEITFNAFSFLRARLQQMGIACCDAVLRVPEGATPRLLIGRFGLEEDAVEAVFINGKAGSFDAPLFAGDRLALVPPGTPGPHRHLLGIRNEENKKRE